MRRGQSGLWTGPLIISLCLASASLLWSALAYRGIAQFGSWMLIVTLGGELWHEPLRQFDAWMQLPAFLLMKLGGSADRMREILLTWNISFMFQPLLSLIACWVICARAKAREAFLFPLFSFAAATLMIAETTCFQVVSALSVFWPLFLLQWIGKKGPARTAGLLLAAAALVFTHEIAFLFFIVLAVTAYRGKEPVPAVLFGSAAVGLLIHGLTLSSSKMDVWLMSAMQPWGPIGWSMLIATGAFMAAIALESRDRFRGKFALILAGGWTVSALTFAAMAFRTPSSLGSIDQSCHLRVLAPFLASVVALVALVKHRLQGKQWATLSYFVAAVLLLATVNDLAKTQRWSAGISHLKKDLAEQGRPCLLLSDLEYAGTGLETDFPGFFYATLPTTSILIQESRRPLKVAGVRSYAEGRHHVDFCEEVSKGTLPTFEGDSIPLGGGYLDFTQLTGKLRQ